MKGEREREDGRQCMRLGEIREERWGETDRVRQWELRRHQKHH